MRVLFSIVVGAVSREPLLAAGLQCEEYRETENRNRPKRPCLHPTFSLLEYAALPQQLEEFGHAFINTQNLCRQYEVGAFRHVVGGRHARKSGISPESAFAYASPVPVPDRPRAAPTHTLRGIDQRRSSRALLSRTSPEGARKEQMQTRPASLISRATSAARRIFSERSPIENRDPG